MGTGDGRRDAIAQAWRDLIADPKHGPLPALLVVMTLVTGVVDAVSILGLGKVFVANMTGNLAFSGFALAGAPGFHLDTSLCALAGFLIGAFGAGQAIRRRSSNRAALARNAITVELIILVVALVLALVIGTSSQPDKDVAATVTAVGLGLQNATVRRLGVPDLTTTVMTMTLTGIAADPRAKNRTAFTRRLLAVITLVVGAICGALLVIHSGVAAGLGLAVGLLAVATVGAAVAARHPAEWQTP